jgi:hypothetical protein
MTYYQTKPEEHTMKPNNDLGKTSGTSPPGITVIPNDPDHTMAAQIEAELVAQIKVALKELKSAEKSATAADEARRKAGEAYGEAETVREKKFIATGMKLVEARKLPDTEAFGRILKAVGIDERMARKYQSVALGKVDYRKLCEDNKEAVKRTRAKNKERDEANRAAIKLANAPPKSTSKAKARAEANGTALTSVRNLIKQVCKADKLGHASVLETLARYKKKDGTGAATSAGQLNWSDYNAVREDLKLLLTTYGVEPVEDATSAPVEQPVVALVVKAGLDANGHVPLPKTLPVTPAEVDRLKNHVPTPRNKPVTPSDGFDGADSFGKNNADRDARFLAGFMDECRASAFLPKLSDDGRLKAADFILSGEWKTVEEEAA